MQWGAKGSMTGIKPAGTNTGKVSTKKKRKTGNEGGSAGGSNGGAWRGLIAYIGVGEAGYRLLSSSSVTPNLGLGSRLDCKGFYYYCAVVGVEIKNSNPDMELKCVGEKLADDWKKLATLKRKQWGRSA